MGLLQPFHTFGLIKEKLFMLKNDSNDKTLSKAHALIKNKLFLLFLILNNTFGISRAILAALGTQVSDLQTD
jgi:hypothetical protein